MNNPPHDWSKFHLRININAPLQIILDAWTSQENLEKWFLSKAEYTDPSGHLRPRSSMIEVGDTYRWEWHAADDVAEGKVLSIDPSKSVSFSFMGCTVQVRVFEEGGDNMLEVLQSDIGIDESSKVSYHLGCTRGWTFYMANLKSVLEGGLDLRNRNDKVKDVVNC